jgi:hypothetical protein
MLYEFVTGTMKGKDGANANSARPVKPNPEGAVADKDSQNTLTPADLAAPWHGPQPRKEVKHAA